MIASWRQTPWHPGHSVLTVMTTAANADGRSSDGRMGRQDDDGQRAARWMQKRGLCSLVET